MFRVDQRNLLTANKEVIGIARMQLNSSISLYGSSKLPPLVLPSWISSVETQIGESFSAVYIILYHFINLMSYTLDFNIRETSWCILVYKFTQTSKFNKYIQYTIVHCNIYNMLQCIIVYCIYLLNLHLLVKYNTFANANK